MSWRWLLTRQAQTYTRDGTGQSPGCCERCGGYGMICLDGRRFLCWDHYVEEMKANQQRPAESDC